MSNRRKTQAKNVTLAGVDTSSQTVPWNNASSAESVVFLLQVTDVTAGSITFTIQISNEAASQWWTLGSTEVYGQTAAISSTGNYYIGTNGPVGMNVRLNYAVVTGPVTVNITPIFSRTGNVG